MNVQNMIVNAVDPDGKWVYRVGGISAFVLVIGYFATFPLYASAGISPAGAEAQLRHYAPHLTEWWAILWIMVFTDLLYVPVWLGLFQALKGIGRYLLILALVCKGLFVVLDLVVTWPNFAALYTLSANYVSATDIQKVALIAAAGYPSAVLDSPLLRIYAILIPSLGTFLSGFVMLKGVFHKGVAYLGFAVGVTGILAAVGPFFTDALATMHIINALLATFWFLAVGWKLYKLSQQRA